MLIVISGASGYIGRGLIPKLLERYPDAKIIALSRSAQKTQDPRVEWRACDLFSLRSVQNAIGTQALDRPIDVAFYLVHSMAPTAQLDQGSFADYDLLLADNFSRVLKASGVRQVIYLGGILPRESHLSRHLESRLEVERTFKSYQLPLTVFRAGLIVGRKGSSWEIVMRLVRRLPVMLCPTWLKHQTTPIALQSVESYLTRAVLDPDLVGRTNEIAGCRPLSYTEILKTTSRHLGLKRWVFTCPGIGPHLARAWVSFVTGSPKELVYPLVESLRHDMIADDSKTELSFSELLARTDFESTTSDSRTKYQVQRKTVRSVQRLPLPSGMSAEDVKLEFARWLARSFRFGFSVSIEKGNVVFALFGFELLVLELNVERSDRNRQILSIKRGFLVAESERGRLEFRIVLGGACILAAIHDFKPSLPWFFYRFSQARVHSWVMKAFASHLAEIASSAPSALGLEAH